MCIARENLVNNERELKLNDQQQLQQQQQQQQRQPLQKHQHCQHQMQSHNNWFQSVRKPLRPRYVTRKFVSKAKINLNKYWHKFEEILSTAGDDIKSMSSTYHDFIASQKYKYCTIDRMSSPDLMSNRKLSLLSAVRNQTPNNLHDELNSIVSKNDEDDEDILTLSKNLNETSSTYKPFGDDLYYGVNLNTNTAGVYKAKRCSCYLDPEYDAQFLPPPASRPRPASTSFLPTQQLIALTSSPRAKFSHRNIRLSPEDCQNLENEARQKKSYTKYSIYDTSF